MGLSPGKSMGLSTRGVNRFVGREGKSMGLLAAKSIALSTRK